MRRMDMERSLQGLLISLALWGTAPMAHAQLQQIDFQVIHLPRQYRLSNAPYVAIRTGSMGKTAA
jgi:hypothetical protein